MVSKSVFYAQSTGAVISGREGDGERGGRHRESGGGEGTEWERQRSCSKDSKQETHAEQRVYAGHAHQKNVVVAR